MKSLRKKRSKNRKYPKIIRYSCGKLTLATKQIKR